MKKCISVILAFLIVFGCIGCAGTDTDAKPAASESALKLPKNVQMYVPGITIDTDFGSVTVIDAAFTAKAQIYYSKTSRSSKTTINGKTTETYEETIYPGYLSTLDNKIVFALKTVMTNTTSEDIDLHKMLVKATFAEGHPVAFSKGGNFHISDEAYRTLPAGGSSEIVLAALLPVEQYLMAEECLLEIAGAELGFSYDNINVYNALGFQEGDNAAVTIDEVILAAANSATPHVAETEETEPPETEPEIDTVPGTYKKDGSAGVEGRAIQVKNVEIGFTDTLPNSITSDRSFSHNADQYAINDSQIYAVIKFNLTNLTEEEMKVVDHKHNFMMQMTYDGRYKYTTNSDTYAFFTIGSQYGMVRKGSTLVSPGGMSVSPLASMDVTAYIPCARAVAENTGKALAVTFIAKHSGNESFEFVFDRN